MKGVPSERAPKISKDYLNFSRGPFGIFWEPTGVCSNPFVEKHWCKLNSDRYGCGKTWWSWVIIRSNSMIFQINSSSILLFLNLAITLTFLLLATFFFLSSLNISKLFFFYLISKFNWQCYVEVIIRFYGGNSSFSVYGTVLAQIGVF